MSVSYIRAGKKSEVLYTNTLISQMEKQSFREGSDLVNPFYLFAEKAQSRFPSPKSKAMLFSIFYTATPFLCPICKMPTFPWIILAYNASVIITLSDTLSHILSQISSVYSLHTK